MEKINQKKYTKYEQTEQIRMIVDSAINQLPQNFMENIQDKREFKNNLETIQKGSIIDLIRTQRLRSKLLEK